MEEPFGRGHTRFIATKWRVSSLANLTEPCPCRFVCACDCISCFAPGVGDTLSRLLSSEVRRRVFKKARPRQAKALPSSPGNALREDSTVPKPRLGVRRQPQLGTETEVCQ